MKKISLYFFCLISSYNILVAQQLGQPKTTQGANQPMAQGGLDDEALEWFDEFFKQFSEEELDYFAKLGEQYIEEEMQKGKDLDTIINEVFEPFGQQPEQPQPKPQPVQPIPQPTIPAAIPVTDAKKIEEARSLLKTIIDKIAIIKQRAEHDRKTRDLIKPWKFHLDDLTYYMHALSQEKLIKYLADKESNELYEIIRQLSHELSFYEPLFQVQQVGIEVENPYEVFGLSPAATIEQVQDAYQQLIAEKNNDFINKKMVEAGRPESAIKQALINASSERDVLTESYSTILAQEKSRQALHAILNALAEAVYTKDVFSKIKKILQKYEPEALKIKEEQEKREAEARKEQEKQLQLRPRPAPFVPQPIFDYGYGTTPSIDRATAGGAPYTPSSFGGGRISPETGGLEGLPGKPGAPMGGGKAGPEKKDEKEKKKEGEKKEAEKGPKRKVPETSKKVTDKFKKIDSIFDNLGNYIDQTPEVRAEQISGFKELEKIPTKDLLKNFYQMLQQPMTAYQKSDREYIKAQTILSNLAEITKQLNAFKKELRDLKDMDRKEKRQIRAAATERFDKFKKNYLQKYLGDILNARLTSDHKLIMSTGNIDIPKEKKYIFFGVNEFDDIGTEAKVIEDLNKPMGQTVDEENILAPVNFMRQFRDFIAEIDKELKKQ